MKTVKLLLRENVKDLGKCGDVVQVAAGYSRNYLVPQRIAVVASADNIKLMARRREKLDAREAAQAAEVSARVGALEAVTLKTTGTADENGHLFGSVNAAAIARLLGEAGHGYEEKDVRLAEPIKTVGTHVVAIHVHGDVTANVTVVVEAAAPA